MQPIARLGVIAALLVGLGWLLSRGVGETEALVGGVIRPVAAQASAPELEAARVTEESREPAPRTAGSIESTSPAGVEPTQEESDPFTFLGRLVLPDGQSIRVTEVRASLTGEDSFLRTYEGWNVNMIRFEDVPHGSYDLLVQADGYRHRAEVIGLTITPLGKEQVVRDVTLWPPSWISIVIRTRDGLPFRALADDLELEPMNLFVDAFRVAAANESFASGAPLPPILNELARFHPPPGYQNVELPGAVACSLRLRVTPPMWVGLWVHGIFYEDQLLHADDIELVFELDMDVIDAGLARVSARFVDRDSGAAVVDAKATLKADTSAHRRGDLNDVAPDDLGRLTFLRVIPGQHELTVLREGRIVQRRITLSPGEDLDLGDISIGVGPGLPIRVVDAAGRSIQAWIEIAPLVPGSDVNELYPPNLHRMTGRDGHFVLPVPDQVSVVRARPTIVDGIRRYYFVAGTRNTLVDPDRLPAELVLVAGDPLDLRVEPLTTWIEGHSVTFEDEHGLMVHQAWMRHDGKCRARLVPGPYVVRRWEGEHELGSLDVVITRDMRSVRCP